MMFAECVIGGAAITISVLLLCLLVAQWLWCLPLNCSTHEEEPRRSAQGHRGWQAEGG
jgi:hypothetical protein